MRTYATVAVLAALLGYTVVLPGRSAASAMPSASAELGTFATAARLLRTRPRDEWLALAPTPTVDALVWPIAGARVGRGFGFVREQNRKHIHNGIDLVAEEGTPILAVDDGVVAYSGNRVSGFGNLVLVLHRWQAVSVYAHCSAVNVVAGQVVRAGETIAAVGSTGRAQGPHLHFEWHLEGKALDPLPYFENSEWRQVARTVFP